MTDFREYKLNKKEKVIFYIVLILSGMATSLLFYDNVFFSFIFLLFSDRLLSITESELADRRRRELLLEFKDFLFIVSTAVGAGRTVKEAISEAIPRIKDIYSQKSVLVPELEIIYERLESGNEDDVTVLLEFGEKSGLEDVVDFVSIYSICKKTGASLIIALDKAAGIIMEKMTIEREISQLVKRKETEGMMIFVMPIIVILFLRVTSPDYIEPLYYTMAGRIIMTLVIIGNVGIYQVVKNITRIEI